jgi:hypothetical protein
MCAGQGAAAVAMMRTWEAENHATKQSKLCGMLVLLPGPFTLTIYAPGSNSRYAHHLQLQHCTKPPHLVHHLCRRLMLWQPCSSALAAAACAWLSLDHHWGAQHSVHSSVRCPAAAAKGQAGR